MQIKAHKDVTESHHGLVGDFRSGSRNSRALIYGRENSSANYKLGYGGEGSDADWTTPRHRHTFEQIRYNACGDYMIRPGEYLPVGWIAYFPESVFYGPQVKGKNNSMLTLQFGGPSGLGYWSNAQRKRAYEALEARGVKFADGMASWTDKDGKVHQQDASELNEEEAFNRKMVYPEPRYKDIVLMNPDSFNWIKDKQQPGVATKMLGRFTERDVRVAFIQMEKGAAYNFGAENSDEVLFLKNGKMIHDNVQYGDLTGFATAPEEKPQTITAIEPSELIYMKLPTF